MRPPLTLHADRSLDLSQSWRGDDNSLTMHASEISRMLDENPLVGEWTEQDVVSWLERTGLARVAGVFEAFQRCRVNGQRLLTLTEDELKSRSFGIARLGRRKNVMRAVNYLKANLCRNVHNRSALQHSESSSSDIQVNRSAGSLRPANHSRLGLASIDRSVILTSAHSFFKQKGRTNERQSRPSRF